MKKRRTMRIAAAAISGALLLTGCGQAAGSGNQSGNRNTADTPNSAALDFQDTDPELAEIAERFTQKVNTDSENLSEEQKYLISLVSLVVQQSDGMLEQETWEALSGGVSPEAIREAVYQCAPYVGLPRAVDALEIVNGVFAENNIELPLPSQGTVDENTRFDSGLDAQAGIFGEVMRQIAEGGEEGMARSSFYLVDNCFGDYYTRNGLDLETREMLTLAILVNLGTESQISSHVTGNANLGRSREFISDVIYQCLPYAGYPRILNALNCLNTALPQEDETGAETEDSEAAGAGEPGTAAQEAEGTIFEQGEANPMGDYFTGQTYLEALLSNDDVFHMPTTFHVTFEPCARTDWHSHDGGQILIVTSGVGYHQAEGEPAQILRRGDVVMAEPGVKHWHGAAEDGMFSHIAISTNPDNSGVNWMEPVSDEEYENLEAVEFADRQPGTDNPEAVRDLGAGAAFAIGEPNPYSQYFTGNTYLASMVPHESVFNSPSFSNVTFEPCARTDWHSHDGGQILLVTGGKGWHQIEGQEPEVLEPGDIVKVEPGVKHWHGAAADSWFSHIAVGTNPDQGGVNWMEKVSDAEYPAE